MLTRYSIRLYSDLGAHGLIMLFVFIYVYRCQTLFPYQTYVSFTIAMIGATRGTGTAYRSKLIRLPPLFCGVCITYVYPRCLVEFVLHTFTPVVSWSLYYSINSFVLYRSLFLSLCLFSIAIMCVLRMTASDYPFCIFII